MAGFWNGASIAWSDYSGTFQSFGPVAETVAEADVTRVDQKDGIKEYIASDVRDVGPIVANSFYVTGVDFPTVGSTEQTVTITLDPTMTTVDKIVAKMLVTARELNEATPDGVRMVQITLRPAGGGSFGTSTTTTVGESTTAADSATYTDWFHQTGTA